MRFLWQRLLIRELEKSEFSGTIKWIIDGLDESETNQRGEFPRYVSDLRYTSVNLKVLIVSRYEDIDSHLRSIGSPIVEINAETNHADICTVIKHHVRSSGLLSAPRIIDEITL